ncbi:MAG: hypothetical protein ACXAC8_07330 [Candidatus Hodarchaeales archaeon]|jgi:hypothetical protein
MNRFVRFFKRLIIPQLSHNASREADRRVKIAKGITDDQIFVQTVRNALNVPDADISDKLTFAFTSLPEVNTNFTYAKNMFLDIIDFLISNNEISSEEADLLKNSIKDISSLKDLLSIAA